jgi:hypothetical protein
LVGQIIGEMSGCVLPRQSYEGGMPNLQPEPKWSPTPQTLVVISHPIFSNGYLDGRLGSFQERHNLNDYLLTMRLWSAFASSRYEQANESQREEMLYDLVGQLVGEMSASVLPRQPHEEHTRALQEAFLAKVMPQYRGTDKTLVKLIRQFWILQDQLAQTLDAETFEEMITCGRDLGNPLAAAEA